jgi:hypothetical protein
MAVVQRGCEGGNCTGIAFWKNSLLRQKLSLGLFRSDYMIHADPNETSPAPEIKQVEFNTISSSFGGLSSAVTKLHQYYPSM